MIPHSTMLKTFIIFPLLAVLLLAKVLAEGSLLVTGAGDREIEVEVMPTGGDLLVI